MKKKAIANIFIIILISIHLSGCINENTPDDNTNPIKTPDTVYVDDNFDKNSSGWNIDHFDSIENAINNVSFNGTVYVYNGIYYENIVINKSISIIGEDKETTVINGNRKGNVISIINPQCTIQNMNISNGGSNSGVKILSNKNILTNNTLNDNYYGIWIDSKTQNTVSNNIFSKNYNAIRLRSVSDTIITNNQILTNTMEGIFLETCLRITIKDNIFQESGISLSGILTSWDSHIIENNSVNDKPIYYYKNENGITVPDDANQLIFANCSNIEIKNINFENVVNGIQICYGSDITIKNNYFESNKKNSIHIYHSENITINNNNIEGGNGIDLLDSKNIFILQNIIENTETAINIDTSNNNNISKNSLSNNDNGIYSEYGGENNIYENNIFSNTDYGIYLQTNSNNNIVSKNNIFQNKIAIRIKGSKFNNIITNEIKDNADIGIYICCGASDNIVYKNSFINNEKHVDYTILNINYFYQDGFGNYWDDYVEKYPNAKHINGIWNIAYDITGTNSKDEYPLVNPINV